MSATVAQLLANAAEARRNGRPDGARVWLSLARTFNQMNNARP